jgi:hypothetical protein
LLVYVKSIQAVFRQTTISGRNEKLVQSQLFALTKLNVYKQTVKLSVTAAAAAQKKGT